MAPDETTIAESSPAPETPVTPETDVPGTTDLESLSPEQRDEWLKSGDFPQPKNEEATASSEKAESEPAKDAKKQEPRKNADTRSKELEDEIQALKAEKAARVQRLLDERGELKRELQQPAPRPASQPAPEAPKRPVRPKLAEFDDYDAYEQALDTYEENLADYRVSQRLETERKEYARVQQVRAIEARNAEVRKTYETRLKEVKEKHPDFDDKVKSVSVAMNPVMDGYLLDSPVGLEVVYYFTGHPEEAERIAALNPFQTTRELAKLEAQLSASASAPPPKIVTDAKPPPTTLSGRNKSPEDPVAAAVENNDFTRYAEEMNRREFARLRR